MMIMLLAIQCIATPALRAAQGCDASWNTYHSLSGVDYTDYESVERATALLELDADGAYQYRIVAVASAEESYAELQGENLDVLEALDAWLDAGSPRSGPELEALRRAGLERWSAVRLELARRPEVA